MITIYNFACFIRIFKKACRYVDNSIELFVNKLIKTYNSKFQTEYELYLDKSTISRIMNNKINLPKKILNLLLEDDFEKKINRVFSLYVNEKTKPKLLVDSINELKNEISKAENLNENQKKAISNLEDNIEFFIYCFYS